MPRRAWDLTAFVRIPLRRNVFSGFHHFPGFRQFIERMIQRRCIGISAWDAGVSLRLLFHFFKHSAEYAGIQQPALFHEHEEGPSRDVRDGGIDETRKGF
jgi:hypothetical protein